MIATLEKTPLNLINLCLAYPRLLAAATQVAAKIFYTVDMILPFASCKIVSIA